MTTIKPRSCAILIAACALVLAGCAPGDVPQLRRTPVKPKQPDAQELVTTTLQRINDTVDASGGGDGWHLGTRSDDGWAWTWPMPTGPYSPVPCGAESFTADHGWHYNFVLSDQTPLPDPFVQLANVKAAWSARGWRVRTIAERRGGDNPGAKIAVDFPGGAGMDYSAAHGGAQITASSECSKHPSAQESSK